MANKTIKTDLIVLRDGFPGPDMHLVPPQASAVADWFAGGDAQHNVLTPTKYQPGEKVFVYNQGIPTPRMTQVYSIAAAHKPGWSSFTYLKYVAGSTKTAGTVLDLCVAGAPDAAASLSQAWYCVTNDAAIAITAEGAGGTYGLPLAVCLGDGKTITGTMTSTYYGWFWTGGVCPVEVFAWLGVTAATDYANVVTDSYVAAGALRAVNAASGGGIALGLGTAGSFEVGFALAADDA